MFPPMEGVRFLHGPSADFLETRNPLLLGSRGGEDLVQVLLRILPPEVDGGGRDHLVDWSRAGPQNRGVGDGWLRAGGDL